MSEFFLTSQRLGFRTWSPLDLPLALQLWGDPAVTRFISREPLTEQDVRNRLERERENQTVHGIQYWPIFLLAGGTHVGCCGLRPRPDHPDIPELGVHIRSEHWRQGYALEASRRVIEFAFAVAGYRGLFAGHNPENAASRRLLNRLGFVHTHDEFYAPTGLIHPSYQLDAPTDSARLT